MQCSWKSSRLDCGKPWLCSLVLHRLGLLAHTSYTATFEAILGYMKPCLRRVPEIGLKCWKCHRLNSLHVWMKSENMSWPQISVHLNIAYFECLFLTSENNANVFLQCTELCSEDFHFLPQLIPEPAGYGQLSLLLSAHSGGCSCREPQFGSQDRLRRLTVSCNCRSRVPDNLL